MILDSNPVCISKLDLPDNKIKLSATDRCTSPAIDRCPSSASIVQNKKSDLQSDNKKLSQRLGTESHESVRELTYRHNLLSPNYNAISPPECFLDTPDIPMKVNTYKLEHVDESNHAADKAKSLDDYQSVAVHKPEVKIITYSNYNVISNKN